MCTTLFDPKVKDYNAIINNMINGWDVQKLIKMSPLKKIAPLAIGLIVGANILGELLFTQKFLLIPK